MKNSVALLLSMLMVFAATGVFAADKVPAIYADRTLVTAKVLENALGSQVVYDAAAGTVTITK